MPSTSTGTGVNTIKTFYSASVKPARVGTGFMMNCLLAVQECVCYTETEIETETADPYYLRLQDPAL